MAGERPLQSDGKIVAAGITIPQLGFTSGSANVARSAVTTPHISSHDGPRGGTKLHSAAAQRFGYATHSGRIAKGMDADLVVTECRPGTEHIGIFKGSLHDSRWRHYLSAQRLQGGSSRGCSAVAIHEWPAKSIPQPRIMAAARTA
jgi:hypothetical protein